MNEVNIQPFVSSIVLNMDLGYFK